MQERFPGRVDLSPTAKCNLDCPFCFGPEHSLPDALTTNDWFKVMDFFARKGTKAFVFTGGEPLVRKDIDQLLGHAKGLGMRVTLSTNGILVARHIEAIKDFVDDIGIPIDGSTTEINGLSRVGNKKHLDLVLSMIDFVRTLKPDIEITIRTVVTQSNKGDIENIGKILSDKPIDRWKVCQFSIPNFEQLQNWDRLRVSSEFDEATRNLPSLFPELNVEVQTLAQQMKGYVLVWPNGDIINLYGSPGNVLSTPTVKLAEGLSLLGKYQW